MALDLLRRMRRNRKSRTIRNLVRETTLTVNDLVYPVFVTDAASGSEPISSLPGINRHSLPSLLKECTDAASAGIQAVAIFPVINSNLKNPTGSHGLNDNNILYRALRILKQELPELTLITDVALDPYTSHGHDGLLDSNEDVCNDESVGVLCKLAVKEAQAGADIVAPSDMMDGRVGEIRNALDAAGFSNVSILSYAAKYASAFYGPFRDAVGSKKTSDYIDKQSYQMDPGNCREALLECQLDEDEGADILMVKPAGPYLDVIRTLRHQTLLPIAAYQVSGEYAQIHAAAQLGWLDYHRTRDEALLAIKRAGADMILTYFALEVAKSLIKK